MATICGHDWMCTQYSAVFIPFSVQRDLDFAYSIVLPGKSCNQINSNN